MSIERKLERKHQGLTPDEIEGIKIISGIILLFIFIVWFGSTSQGIYLI
jgi:hypothetical protein